MKKHKILYIEDRSEDLFSFQKLAEKDKYIECHTSDCIHKVDVAILPVYSVIISDLCLNNFNQEESIGYWNRNKPLDSVLIAYTGSQTDLAIHPFDHIINKDHLDPEYLLENIIKIHLRLIK